MPQFGMHATQVDPVLVYAVGGLSAEVSIDCALAPMLKSDVPRGQPGLQLTRVVAARPVTVL